MIKVDDHLCSHFEKLKSHPAHPLPGMWSSLNHPGITVHFRKSGPGNHLFKYCIGRILAERTGQSLSFVTSSQTLHQFSGTVPVTALFDVELAVAGRRARGRYQFLAGHQINWQRIHPRRPILVDGFFENYDFYRPYKNQIRQWLNREQVRLPAIKSDSLCINLRLGQDFNRLNRALRLNYFEEALDEMEWRHLNLVTDAPGHPTVEALCKKYHAHVVPRCNWKQDFLTVMAHPKLIISDSSFCWWAAWLSDASEILCSGPELDNERYGGFWAQRARLSGDDPSRIDLFVRDEPRYRFFNGN